ncbi:MAG: hypothetical protein ACK4RZ_17475 [Paracoccaceae bacterium]
MSGILFTTIAGSLASTALAALMLDALPLGHAVTAYMLGGLFGISVASMLLMLRNPG